MDETARALSTLASDTNERVSAVASASDEASANVQTVAATARNSPSQSARSALRQVAAADNQLKRAS